MPTATHGSVTQPADGATHPLPRAVRVSNSLASAVAVVVGCLGITGATVQILETKRQVNERYRELIHANIDCAANRPLWVWGLACRLRCDDLIRWLDDCGEPNSWSAGLYKHTSLADMRRATEWSRNWLYIHLAGTTIEPGVLDEIQRCPRLVMLNLRDTKVPLADVAAIGRMTSLTILGLEGVPATDHEIGCLVGLKNLRYLCLDHTLVTEKSLQSLQQLPNLRSLSIRNCGQLNARPEDFAALAKLKELDVDDALVDTAFSQALRRLRPGLLVNVYPEIPPPEFVPSDIPSGVGF